jgi:hypothetical protein
MTKDEAYNIIVKEYLSKCNETGCDGCIAETYCIRNGLRTDRYPQHDCAEKLKTYLRQK